MSVSSKHKDSSYTTYLLTWNPGKFEWDDFQEDWDAFYSGSRPLLRWSCGNTKKIVAGDRVFLIRLGRHAKSKGIIASGVTTTAPFEASHWNIEGMTFSALYVEFEPDALLNPDIDDPLDPHSVSEDFNWFPQSSGITIPNEIAVRLEVAWQGHIQKADVITQKTQIPKHKGKKYREGSRTLVTSYRYERDPNARQACIQHYGTSCAVCGFNFGKEFGDIGEGFIHVHHLKPISEYTLEYQIDPIEDLRPVCPNCHAMLHRATPPYSIEELMEIRRRAVK